MFIKVKGFLLFLLLSGLFFSSCTYRQTVHGVVFYDAYEQIEPSLDTKKEVLALMGEPALRGAFRPNIWYYVSSRRNHNSFNLPKRIEHPVVTLTFNKNDLLIDKKLHSALKVKPVKPDPETTSTVTVQRGILQEVFGNIGQIN